ncbi:hypothetical protein [Leifsonia xyli]|uniref:hypothetical protein n=1 Tax=Leifsonia xyli TaxID=1575 RepID=UPI0012FD6C15
MSTRCGRTIEEDGEEMDVTVYVVMIPHEITPMVVGVYFELAEAEAAAEASQDFTVVDSSLLHA